MFTLLNYNSRYNVVICFSCWGTLCISLRKMRSLLLVALACTAVQYVVGPPVTQKKDAGHDSENEIEDLDERAQDREYHRYLMEVLQVLENDNDFRAKVKEASEADIRSGKIADQLQFVSHNVRSKLDEIKRKELERLRHLAAKEQEMRNGLDTDHMKIAGHVDHTNTRTFEIYDLKKLIAKISKDLAETDNKRREEFKQHEMEMKYEEQKKLEHMNEAERVKYEQELKALKEKHKNHEPVHHPGSKQQLEEVWEKQDHMEAENFNPKTFFYMHDIDGNGVWDPDEVKALFLKELDKLYAQGASQEELMKRVEEMERMREHVFNEADLNKDTLISYDEFLEQTKKPEFQKDEGWQGLDEEGQIFTQEEFEEFERLHKQEEMQRMIAQGIFPPQYAHPVPPQDFQHQQQYFNPVPGQAYQQQVYQQQMTGQQVHTGQVPVQQHQGQVPVQQHQGQVPVQQHQGQVPVQQHQGQVPVQQHQGQVPVQQHQGQVPIQQQPQGQILSQQDQVPNTQQQPQQIVANQIPQNVQSNVASPQQHNQPNSQFAQVPVQQEINRNNIPAVGKV